MRTPGRTANREGKRKNTLTREVASCLGAVAAKRPLLVAIEGKREQKERRAISTNNPPIS
jgi:hypothetical protein